MPVPQSWLGPQSDPMMRPQTIRLRLYLPPCYESRRLRGTLGQPPVGTVSMCKGMRFPTQEFHIGAPGRPWIVSGINCGKNRTRSRTVSRGRLTCTFRPVRRLLPHSLPMPRPARIRRPMPAAGSMFHPEFAELLTGEADAYTIQDLCQSHSWSSAECRQDCDSWGPRAM